MDKKAVSNACKINNILLIITISANIIMMIINKRISSIFSIGIIYLFILFVMSIYISITKNVFFLGVLYLCAGVGTVFIGESGNLSATAFIMLSMSVHRSIAATYVTISIMLLAVIIKALYINMDIISTLHLIIVYSGGCWLYYIIILKKVIHNGRTNKF